MREAINVTVKQRMKEEFTSRSESETLLIAEKLGQAARKGDVFALIGELGAGKTIIAKGIARGLGIEEEITSPTFTLLEVYQHRTPLYHFDLFRIESTAEFDQLAFEEYWDDDGVSVIEWAERAESRLPENTITVYIEYLDEIARRIIVEYPDN